MGVWEMHVQQTLDYYWERKKDGHLSRIVDLKTEEIF